MLTNSKEEALTMAFRGEQSSGESSLEELTKAIIEDGQQVRDTSRGKLCRAPRATLRILVLNECRLSVLPKLPPFRNHFHKFCHI